MSSAGSFSDKTKACIIQAVLAGPGRTGRQIADSLGLDKSRVNSFLYSEKDRYGLVNSQWRWYPSVSVRESARKSEYKIIPEISICSNLAAMTKSNATIKIRGMSLDSVELAFQEDEYAQLDDHLQAELAMRNSLLTKGAPREATSKSVNWWPWIIAALVIIYFLIIRP